MSYKNNITHKVGKAAQAFLQANIPATTIAAASILRGIDNPSIPIPRILCTCQEAVTDGDLQFDGMWVARLRIIVTSSAGDFTGDQHDAIASEAFAWFMTGTIAADLSAAIVDFTAEIVIPRRQAWRVEGNEAWQSEMEFDVKCGGSTIA